jgi:hypothetical protein
MSRCLSIAVLTLGAALMLPAANARAQGAAACGPEAVSARGENSRFAWTARTKARANWRRKVRATPGLGPDYANWARAQSTEERCLAGPVGTVCIFTGVPCKG